MLERLFSIFCVDRLCSWRQHLWLNIASKSVMVLRKDAKCAMTYDCWHLSWSIVCPFASENKENCKYMFHKHCCSMSALPSFKQDWFRPEKDSDAFHFFSHVFTRRCKPCLGHSVKVKFQLQDNNFPRGEHGLSNIMAVHPAFALISIHPTIHYLLYIALALCGAIGDRRGTSWTGRQMLREMTLPNRQLFPSPERLVEAQMTQTSSDQSRVFLTEIWNVWWSYLLAKINPVSSNKKQTLVQFIL